MKKLIALMLALIACFTMLVACGDEEDSESSSSSSESQSEIVNDELPEDDTSGDNVVKFN